MTGSERRTYGNTYNRGRGDVCLILSDELEAAYHQKLFVANFLFFALEMSPGSISEDETLDCIVVALV